MYDEEMRAIALAAMAGGQSLNSISKRLGASRATLRDWRDRERSRPSPADCPPVARREAVTALDEFIGPKS
jgi:transposase